MELRPTLSTLLRHKTAALLIVLEIALSCAIICNAIFLIASRLERIRRPSGLAESEIVFTQVTGIGADTDAAARARADVAALRAIPGVKAVASINQIPYAGSSWNSGVRLKEDQGTPNLNAATYMGDEQLIETYGLKLIAGRDFTAGEYVDLDSLNRPGANVPIPATIVTKAFAEKLFPGENAIGKSFYSWGDSPIRIVGIVESLLRPNDQGWPQDQAHYAMIFPVRISQGWYALRADPAQRESVKKAVVDTLTRVDPNRLFDRQDLLSTMRDEYYGRDRSVAWLLVIVCVGLLIITAFGIGGLASFWVQQRTKHIGVRRALGATRGQILRYFQTENFMLATLGIALGMLGAFGLNQVMMRLYELPRLPVMYLPIGALTLWLLGQIAVYGPARRAAAVPPAVATRSV